MKMKQTCLRSYCMVVLMVATLLLHAGKAAAIEQPLIFPIPQQLTTTGESFEADETVSILLPLNASEKDKALARMLVKEFSNKYGIALLIKQVGTVPSKGKFVVMGTMANSFVKKYCSENKLSITKQSPGPEGYILEVNKNSIVIGGYDDAGAFFGLQSLRQLMTAGKGKIIQGVKVKDWPNLPFRAIRLYVPGPDNIPYFKRFLSDFMALYKYNKVIIEFNCMRLDRHPEVNTGWQEFVKYMQYSRSNSTEGVRGEEKNSSHFDAGDGFVIEKETVRDLVKYANDNFLEVIPEIPSLTHAYYLLTKHPELAEYPGDTWPDTYCPSNPDSYKLMFDVYDEYMEVLKPKMVHIGHDEWWGAPTQVCPLCKGKDYSKLFAGDVQKIHAYFAAKGIKIGMWGDYLLESVREKGTQKRTSSTGVKYETPGALPPAVVKEMIPKDILISNWFWIDEEKEKELNDMGFTQLYGNFTPNISNWKERTKKIKVAGGAPSSWAMTNEFNFGKDLMLDFLGCANLMWSSHTIEPIDFPAVVWEMIPSIRANLRGRRIPSEDDNAIEAVDISSHFNLSKQSKLFDVNLTNMVGGEVRKGPKTFKLAATTANENCVIAAGVEGKEKTMLPASIKGIAINEDVSSLIFLHASALPSGNQKAYFNIPNMFDSPDLLGWYEVVYEDGFKEIVPVQYGVNILEWNPGGEKSLDTLEGETGAPQKAYCYEADPVDCSVKKGSNSPTFFSFEWINKRFGKVIKEVNLYGSIRYQALQQNYGTVETEPMKSNAILLAGISKVKKRETIKPKKE
ncbi:MAG TPA: glycoside hydrolase family 20 zincin-like fold domain-containing protein [Chitinophagaceae bacterium]